MLAITHHRRGLSGKAAAVSPGTWAPAFVNAGVPIATSPPGANPGSISTTPTVTVVQPPMLPPVTGGGITTTSPTTADTPTVTVTPGYQPDFPGAQAPTREWLPWVIGGGVLAAVGAVVVVFLNR